MSRRFLILQMLTAVLAAVVSVDISPEAVEMLVQRGGNGNVWISDIFYA